MTTIQLLRQVHGNMPGEVCSFPDDQAAALIAKGDAVAASASATASTPSPAAIVHEAPLTVPPVSDALVPADPTKADFVVDALVEAPSVDSQA
jgi:hypothetical protein